MTPRATPFRGSLSDLPRPLLEQHRRVLRDVYAQHEPEPVDEFALLSDAALVAVPDAHLDRWTAARWWVLPVDHRDGISLTRPPKAPVSEHPGLVTRRAALHPDDRDLCRGRRVTALPRTFVDLAATSSLRQLVAVGDVVARRVGLAPIQAAIGRAGRRKGVVLARSALPLLDPRSGSPAETSTRLVLHGAGFTSLRHAVVLHDCHGGWIGEADLADEQAMVAIQYDGSVHFEGTTPYADGVRRHGRHDVDRDELARLAGWEVVVQTARDLANPLLMINKVTAAYERAAERRRGRATP
jgi:hypothetical protein